MILKTSEKLWYIIKIVGSQILQLFLYFTLILLKKNILFIYIFPNYP